MLNCQEQKIKADMQFEKLANTTKKCLLFRKMENDVAAQQKSEVAKKKKSHYLPKQVVYNKEKLKSTDFVVIVRNNPYLVTK